MADLIVQPPQAATREPPASGTAGDPGPNYKWVALSNTTLGVLIVTIDSSIVLIALPDIFRGIASTRSTAGQHELPAVDDPGLPRSCTAVLVVSLGRLGDIYGRVRIYNLGFVVFTVFSILLSVTWMHGSRRRAVADR